MKSSQKALAVRTNCQGWVLNRKEGDQTLSYNQFEPGLNRSISVTDSIDPGGFLEFSCYLS